MIGMFFQGWTINQVVACENHSVGTRQLNIYHVRLERCKEATTMRVTDNPVIQRLITEAALSVVPVADWDTVLQSITEGCQKAREKSGELMKAVGEKPVKS